MKTPRQRPHSEGEGCGHTEAEHLKHGWCTRVMYYESNKPTTTEASKLIKSCTGSDCPERRSVCCGAGSEASIADEGTGCFVCTKCKREFIGGRCTTMDNLPAPTREEMLKACEPQKDWRVEFEKKFPVADFDFSESSADILTFISLHISEAEERGYAKCWEQFKDMNPFQLGEKQALEWVLANCTSADWPEKIMQ